MKILKNVFRGFFIGIANAIPGVSGGTIAFLLGIYEQFIDALSNITDFRDSRFKKRFIFLCQLGIGVLAGAFFAFKIFNYFFEENGEVLRFFFMGLILFSIPSILNTKMKKMNKKDVWFIFLGLLVMWVIGIQNENFNSQPNLNSIFYVFKLFTISLISAGAMILPGLSGSFLLLVFGEYENISAYIINFNFFAIFIIGFGVTTGILILSKVMDKLFKKHREATISTVLGIIIGSTIKLIPSPITGENIIFDIMFFIIGGFLVLKLSKIKN